MTPIPRTERYSQKIVAAEKCHHSSLPGNDDIMLEAHNETQEGIQVSFCRLLLLLRINAPDKNAHKSEKGIRKEYVFIQFFDVVPTSCLRIDNVEFALDCIRLKWERHVAITDLSISGEKWGGCAPP